MSVEIFKELVIVQAIVNVVFVSVFTYLLKQDKKNTSKFELIRKGHNNNVDAICDIADLLKSLATGGKDENN